MGGGGDVCMHLGIYLLAASRIPYPAKHDVNMSALSVTGSHRWRISETSTPISGFRGGARGTHPPLISADWLLKSPNFFGTCSHHWRCQRCRRVPFEDPLQRGISKGGRAPCGPPPPESASVGDGFSSTVKTPTFGDLRQISHMTGITVNIPTRAFSPLMCILFVCGESCFYTSGRIDWVGGD